MNSEKRNFREKYILHPGDTITSGNTVFTITNDLVAYGGSAIIYSAVSTESSIENSIKYIIKEIFPNEDLYERQSGIIQPRDPRNATELKWFRAHLAEEHDLGGLCYNGTHLAVPVRHIIRPDKITISGKEYIPNIQDGTFAVLDNIAGKAISFSQMLEHIKQPKKPEFPLQNGGCPTLHTTACLIEEVLLTLQSVHNQNVLFGDIHMDNIWFGDSRLDLGKIRTAIFMDFGCSRKLVDGKQTAPITDQRIFSSKGYRPPELSSTWLSQHGGRLSIQADIFSVGCLMLRCLFPKEYWDHFGESPVIGPHTLKYDDIKRLGIDNTLCTAINAILQKAMHQDPKERYSCADAMLKAIQDLKRDTEPPKYLLPTNLSSPDYWVPHSRDQILSVLAKSVNDGKNVFLHGVGGIGKSETARALAKQLQSPRGAFLIHYQNSMRETIMHLNFSGYKFRPSQIISEDMLDEMEYQDRLRILKDHYHGTVLVIDNFNVDNKSLEDLQGEMAYQDIIELSDISFIFTTRYEVIEHPEWEIKALEDSAALQILKQYCPQVSDILLKRIVSAVHGHTLTLTLIGKSIRESQGKITAARVLEALENNTLSQMDCPVISSDKDRRYRQADIYAHLKILFNLSSLSEMQKSAMIFASFLSGDGLPYKRLLHVLWEQTRPSSFESYEENEQHQEKCSDAFRALIKYGWLKTSPEDIITIHPVIQELVIGELKPSLSNCERGLERLRRVQFRGVGMKVLPDSFQLASYFSRAGKILNAEWYIECGETIRAELTKQDAKLAPHIKSMAITQRKADVTSSELADRYEQIGLTHIALDGHGKQAIDSCLEALRLRENDPQTTKEQLAWTLFYVGLAYQHHHGELGYWITDVSDSLLLADDYHRRALSIWNGLPPFGVERFNIAHDKSNCQFYSAYSQMLSDYGYRHFPEVHEHDKEVLYWLQVEATLEDVTAMLSLARRYRDGIGCIKDIQQSYYWASMAVAVQTKHDSLMLPNSGHTEVDHYFKDCVTHYGYYEKPLINGARVFLASQIINDVFYSSSEEEKTYWTWYAAEAGDLRYMVRYAICLINGTGCREDRGEAFAWLCRIAKIIGNNKSNELTYRHRDSWPRDLEDVKNENIQILEKTHQVVLHNFDETHIQKWYHCAVTAGNLEYVDNLGKYLLNNATRTEDYREAFGLFLELSGKGSALADYYLGCMYLNGYAEGNVQDIDKALSYFCGIIDYSDKACLALAEIYFGLSKTTNNVLPEPSMALFCCHRAADLRREDSKDLMNYETSDILHLIETWENNHLGEEWTCDVYFALSDFYFEHALETHRVKAEEYLSKGKKLKETEPEESPVMTEEEFDEEFEKEIERIIDELIKDLE